MSDLASLRDVLARAVHAIDDLGDDLDALSAIGGPADALYDSLREIDVLSAALSLDAGAFEAARNTLRSAPDREGKLSWLTGRGGLSFEQATLLADLDESAADRVLSHYGTVRGLRTVLLSDASQARQELLILLDEHEEENGAFVVPDTLPAGW